MTTNKRSGTRGEAYERLVRQEELILNVTEGLTEALRDAGVTRAELARRLGRTPGFVSQLLGGGRNLTLRTISDIALALSLRPALDLRADPAPVVDTDTLGPPALSAFAGPGDGPAAHRAGGMGHG